MEDLMILLKGLKEEVLDEARIEAAVQSRGLSLVSTSETVERLKAGGASDSLLQLILKLAPPPAPTPTPLPTGALSATCSPPECRVRVNGAEYRATENGKLTIGGLSLGTAFVDFQKDGYLSRQESVTITAGNESHVSSVLEPDDATKARFGQALLASLLEALGRESGLASEYDFSASGSASLWDSEGRLSEWDISLKFGPPDLADLEVRAALGDFALLCRGEKCQPKPGKRFGGKRIKGSEAAEIATNLRVFRRYCLPFLLEQIASHDMKPAAVEAKPRGNAEQHLQIASSGEAYELTLDAELLPADVTYTSKTGLGSGLHVAYADYVKVGKLLQPRRTQIRLPGPKQHGISVRLTEITAGANLRERDFPPK